MIELIAKIDDFYNNLKRTKKTTKRMTKVLDQCGCCCYCPNCNDILNDQADMVDIQYLSQVHYYCNNCKHHSIWNFDVAPIPTLIWTGKDK